MARVKLLEKDEVEAGARRVYEALEKQYGVVIPPMKALAHRPEVLRAVANLTGLLHSPSTIDAGLKELINLRASQLNGCEYCVRIHSAMARRHKVPHEKVDACAAFEASPLFDEREKAALAYCEEASRERVPVREETFARLKAAFDDGELVELTCLIGLINFWNRFILALGF
ncbi:MAG: carboxymuconolactone decarboxylase family protein [Nitrospinota bacterium]